MKKILFISSLLFTAFVARAQNTDTVREKLTKLTHTDYEMQPRVGNANLSDYLAGKIPVPADLPAKSHDYAIVAFHVDSNGTISNARIFKSFLPDADKSVIDALNSLQSVKPAILHGQNVGVDLAMGVRFGPARFNDNTIKAFCFLIPADPTNSEQVYVAVATPPSFPGGNSAFDDFLQKNIVYPPHAKANNIQGKVILTFVIKKDGSLANFKVLRSPDDDLSKEAIRVMQSCPNYNPGMQNGNAVNVQYTIVVPFVL